MQTPQPNPDSGRCVQCGEQLENRTKGRRKRYCSDACRHRAWEIRQAAKQGAVAQEVIELPPIIKEAPYSVERIIEFLREKPQRLADIVQELPYRREALHILRQAENRLVWKLREEDEQLEEILDQVLEDESGFKVIKNEGGPEFSFPVQTFHYRGRDWDLPVAWNYKTKKRWVNHLLDGDEQSPGTN